MRTSFFLFLFCAVASAAKIQMERKDLPLSVFNLSFRVGSADDPGGKEGLADMTGTMLREGGVKSWEGYPALNRSQIEEVLFPLGAEIGVRVHKEQTTFTVTAPVESSEKVFALICQMILAPAFDSSELTRLKDEALDALTKRLPREDQEELGKAVLEAVVYGKEHPYSHVPVGTVAGVKSITKEDLEEFHKARFTRKRLTMGLAGVITPKVAELAKKLEEKLAEGATEKALLPAPPKPKGVQLTIVKGPFESTGVHAGLATDLLRGHPDFPAMYLASMAFGKHRSFVGRLMKVVREIRGLNYGAYSYVEDFPYGGHRLIEPTQVARAQQSFTVWARPTPIHNGCFLLRQIAREISSLAEKGLTKEEFELTKSHLIGSIPLLAPNLERQLAYEIDAKFYGIASNYAPWLVTEVSKLDLKKVNATLKKYLDPSKMNYVVVTGENEAATFKQEVLGKECKIQYGPGIKKPAAVLKEDKQISTFNLKLTPEAITITDSATYF